MDDLNKNCTCVNASVEETRHDLSRNHVPKPAQSSSRKRARSARSSSSSSSPSSSSDSTDSASSSDRKKRGRHHKRRGGKYSRKSRKDNRQIHKLFREVSALRNQIAVSSSVPCGDAEPTSVIDNDLWIDDSVSGILYNDGSNACTSEPTQVQLPFNFDIETKLKEPAVPKAPDNLLKALQDIQYFNKSEWTEVRYSEVQKSYCRTPGFIDLEANEEIRAYDQLRHLAYADKAYAALTFCALEQRQALSSTLIELLSWAHAEQGLNFNSLQDKITEVFSKGDFHKASSDLLQLICGHRAEVIQMRRDGITNHVRDPLIKATLRNIPPSDRHLFESESFTAALEKMSGVKKTFMPLAKPTSGSASQAGPSKAVRHPPQGSAHYHGPSQGTSHGCCTSVPHPHYQYRQSSQDCYHERPQRQSNQSDRRTAPTSNNRGSSRSRVGYKPQSQGKGNRKCSRVSSDYNFGSSKLPVAHNNRVSHTLSSKTTSNVATFEERALHHTGVRINVGTHQSDERPRCIRNNATLPELPVNNVSCAKERWLRPPKILPRRLPGSSPGQGHSANSCSYSPEPSRISRMASKPKEIRCTPTKESCVPGSSVGSLGQQKISAARQGQISYPQDLCKAELGQGLPTRIAKPSGPSKLCRLCGATGQTTSPVSAQFSKGISKYASQEGDPLTRGSPSRSSVVASQLPPNICNPSTTTNSLCDHIRLRSGLGSSGGRLHSVRCVDCSRITSTLQLKRDAGHLKGARNPRSSTVQVHCSVPVRQSNSCGSLAERGRHEIATSDGSNVQSVPLTRLSSNKSDSQLYTRHLQRTCGSPLQTQASTRMASSARLHGEGISQVGHSGSRSICAQSSKRGSQLRVSGFNRYPSVIPQCLFPVVELPPCVGVPTTILDTQGAGTPQLGDRAVPFNCPPVGSGIRAGRSHSSSSSISVVDHQSQGESNRHHDRSTTPQGSRDGARSLEVWGWSKSLTGWNEDQIHLLKSSWRTSTLKTYKVAWDRWVSWNKKYNLDPFHPTGPIVARYLADLHLVDKFSYSTILLHKSVVATLGSAEDAGRISSHTLVKHVLKSIALKKPVAHKPPVWNIDALTSFLSSNTVDENNPFATSRHTATLLLLCSSRRVHDLTLLLVDSEHCIDDGSNIILKPVFGSKTDSDTHRQSGWKLLPNTSNKNLDPVFWVRKLIDLLRDRRDSGNCQNLFINIRGQAKAASRTVIAGWVKTVLTEAGIPATPGSLRSAVSSKNWSDNLPLDEILSRGNWKSKETFTRFYRREILPASASNSITRMFNPAD